MGDRLTGRSSLRLARPFRAFVVSFGPIIRFLNSIANLVIRAFGVEPQDERAMAHSPTDLMLLLNESAGHGDIDKRGPSLLTRSLELSGLTAADAMTLRRDIVDDPGRGDRWPRWPPRRTAPAAPASSSTTTTSIMPRLHARQGPAPPRARNLAVDPVRSMVRPLKVTPEHHRLEDLLVEMRTERFHISLVVDEHGTVVGLVSLEDVFEELIGDFDDESDDRLGDCDEHGDGSVPRQRHAAPGRSSPSDRDRRCRTGTGRRSPGYVDRRASTRSRRRETAFAPNRRVHRRSRWTGTPSTRC